MFDTNTLKELGFKGLDEEQEKMILDKMNATIEMRVGTRIQTALSDKELEEFTKVLDEGGDKAAQKWLTGKMPSYEVIVKEESEAFLKDIKDMGKARQEAMNDQDIA